MFQPSRITNATVNLYSCSLSSVDSVFLGSSVDDGVSLKSVDVVIGNFAYVNMWSNTGPSSA